MRTTKHLRNHLLTMFSLFMILLLIITMSSCKKETIVMSGDPTPNRAEEVGVTFPARVY